MDAPVRFWVETHAKNLRTDLQVPRVRLIRSNMHFVECAFVEANIIFIEQAVFLRRKYSKNDRAIYLQKMYFAKLKMPNRSEKEGLQLPSTTSIAASKKINPDENTLRLRPIVRTVKPSQALWQRFAIATKASQRCRRPTLTKLHCNHKQESLWDKLDL